MRDFTMACVIRPGAQSEHVPQQPHSQIGIFVLRADVARELVARYKLIELIDGIIDIRIRRIFGVEILGHSRQARALRRKILQA